jgi:hypothetical protein
MGSVKKTEKKPLSPKGGGLTGPGPGRTKGVRNKKTLLGMAIINDGLEYIGGQGAINEYLTTPSGKTFFLQELIRSIMKNLSNKLSVDIAGTVGVGLTAEAIRKAVAEVKNDL